MKLAKFFLGFIVISIFMMFATANLDRVQVNFLFENQPLLGYSNISINAEDGNTTLVKEPRRIPIFLLIFGSFGVGFVISWVLSSSIVRSCRKNLKIMKKQCDILTKERDELRNLPVNGCSDTADGKSLSTKSTLPVT